MFLPVISNVDDVVERQLCCGCGACAGIAPERIEMIDDLEHGRRPRYRTNSASQSPGPLGLGSPATSSRDPASLAVCPGLELRHSFDRRQPDLIRSLLPGWGPVLEVWEGFANNDRLRFAASSGGAASALAIACIERLGMHGVLHIRARRDAPLLNETVLSTTRQEVADATGSRYAPASPCDGLHLVEEAPGPCVVIGKPCDIAAARKTEAQRPALRNRIGATVAFFCAGTPTTAATLELLKRLGVDDPADVVDLRYRGNGWPGSTAVTVRTRNGLETRKLTYEESWGGILTNHKQWRCHVCADHTGEFADIAVGDPWYRDIEPGETGRSLILVRTERGRRLLRAAMDEGYIIAERADPEILPRSQGNLLRGRGAVWARLLVCRVLGVAAPRYRGLPMFRFWWSQLTLVEKLRSLAGTVRRIRRRGLRGRIRLEPYVAERRESAPEVTISTRAARRRTAA